MAVRGFQSDVQDNWANGVITAIVNDRLPDGSVPSAKNAQFYNIGPQKAIFGTRLGCELQNTTAGTSAFVSQYFFHPSGSFHLLVNSAGDLQKIVAGALSTITSTLFTVTTGEFSWQTFHHLAYVVNGTDAKKTNGTTSSKFGIAQPASGAWAISAVAGGAAIAAGTYDVSIAYYNSTTGHLGPRADIKTVTLAGGQRIQVDLPNSGTIADSQVDYIQIFLRQQATTNQLFLVTAGTDVAISGVNGWPVGTTPVKIDSSNAQITAFIILAPGPNDNFPPPTGTKFIQNLRNRMFAAVGADLYWSDLGKPESYNLLDSTEPIGEDDGESITGLAVLNDTLVIFKKSAVYYLDGDDPQTWIIRIKDKSIGSVNYNGIATYTDNLYFMSLKGPHQWVGLESQIQDITTEFIGPNFDADHIDPDDLASSIVVLHPTQNYVGWAVQPSTESKNTVIIPFHLKLNRWMSDEWRMVDVRSCAVIEDSTGREWPFIADYDGWLYKVGVGGNDGLPPTLVSEGTVTASSSTTLTDSAAAWTSNKLIGKYVSTWNTVNGLRAVQRRKITANTSTQLTVSPAFDSNPNFSDPYSVAGILFDWISGFRNGGQEFFRKRLEFVFTELGVSSEGEHVTVEAYVNGDQETPVLSRTITIGRSDFWDDSNWDEMFFAGTGEIIKRIPIRHICNNWQTRLLHLATDEQVFLSRLGVQWLTKTKKTGEIGGDSGT